MQPKGTSLVQRNVLYSSFVALVIKQMTRNATEIQMLFFDRSSASPKYEAFCLVQAKKSSFQMRIQCYQGGRQKNATKEFSNEIIPH